MLWLSKGCFKLKFDERDFDVFVLWNLRHDGYKIYLKGEDLWLELRVMWLILWGELGKEETGTGGRLMQAVS